MALFSLRKPRKEQAAPPSPTETVEAVRRRALHRLIGAAVLVIAGVIGFPLIFDNQPRPIPVDLPIEIADKDKVPPLQITPMPSAASSAPAAAVPRNTPEAQESAPVAPLPAESPRAAVAEAPSPAASVPPARAEAAPPPAAPRPADTSDAQKARALLEGRAPAAAAAAATTASAAAASARFVVQVGAFAEEQSMREVRRKVERAGFKTYTQMVTTKEGARTRVRVGPFEDRSKAQQAADSIRQLGLSPSVLTL